MISDGCGIKGFPGGEWGKDPREQDLERCAYELAEKYQAGQLPELKQTGLTAAWRYLIKDLRTCCPGFSEIEYGIALNQAFIDR